MLHKRMCFDRRASSIAVCCIRHDIVFQNTCHLTIKLLVRCLLLKRMCFLMCCVFTAGLLSSLFAAQEGHDEVYEGSQVHHSARQEEHVCALQVQQVHPGRHVSWRYAPSAVLYAPGMKFLRLVHIQLLAFPKMPRLSMTAIGLSESVFYMTLWDRTVTFFPTRVIKQVTEGSTKLDYYVIK